MNGKPNTFLINRLVTSIRTIHRPITGYVHTITGKRSPTLGEFCLPNPGKMLTRLPDGTRCSELLLGKYGQRAVNFQQRRTHMHQIFTKKTVQERIMLVLNLFDKIDNDKLTFDSDFFKDLGLDSLDFVEVILSLEDEFCFEIPDGDSDRMRTPRDIYQYICDKCDVYD